MAEPVPWIEPGEFPDGRTRRLQTAMVMFALEQGLARYIQDAVEQRGADPRGTIADIAKREHLLSPNIRTIVPLTYLGDLVVAVRECAQGTSHADAADRIKKVFDVFEVYDIRNAVAHPNREFPSYYWYRAKAIAAEPALQQLGLEEVHRALISAMSGQLREPPEEWILSLRWRLPSNLPTHFEHEITGLMGRKKERDDLLRLIRNQKLNLLAVVAPGGIGKTALLLDCLREIEGSPADAMWVDQIVWVTGKTHVLSVSGEQRIAADATLKDLQRDIADVLLGKSSSFEDAVSQLADKRVLLAIDNLETLIRDSPDEFNTFYRELPSAWRLVVTSRVLIDSATTLSLGPLKQEGAMGLAHAYAKWKGVLDLPEIGALVDRCGRNPLAIRIVVDGYAAGGALPDLLLATRQNLIAYSFKFLTTRLDEIQKRLLEALFVSETEIGRLQLAALLEATVDDVASALTSLLKTSLVARVPSQGEERYELNAGIRELLLIDPVDLSFREDCNERRRRDRNVRRNLGTKQTERGIGPLSPFYVPETGANEQDAVMGFKVAGALQSQNTTRPELIRLTEEIRVRSERGALPPYLDRLRGLVLLELGDKTHGLQALRTAATGPFYDPAAAAVVARHLAHDGDLDVSVSLSSQLIKDGWADPNRVGEEAAAQIRRNHWVHRCWNKDAPAVAAETADWEKMGYLAPHAGLVHAQALRRSVEHKYSAATWVELEAGLLGSVETFDRLIELYGAAGRVVREVSKLIEQLAYAARSNRYRPSAKARTAFVSFVERRLPEICDVNSDLDWDGPEVDNWRRAISAWGPLKFNRSTDSTRRADEPTNAARRAKIFYRPKSDHNHLFARDEQGIEYHVSRSSFLGSFEEWKSLAAGTWLLIWLATQIPGKATPAVRSSQREQ